MHEIIKKLIPKSIKQLFIDDSMNETKNNNTNKPILLYSATNNYNILVSEKPKLKGKTAVVTGGNGAIGRAVCFRLAAEGAKVYVSGRNKEKVTTVTEEIRSKGLLAEPMIMDVTDADSIEQTFNKTFENENLDILVSNAGGSAREFAKTIEQQSIEIIDNILNTNLRGSILCTRKALQNMVKNNIEGKIVITSSVVGIQGLKKYSEYAAAKAGDIGFVRSTALEFGKYGININCVSPGYIQRGYFSDKEIYLSSTKKCLSRMGTVEDVANAILFLVSDEAKYITGQNLCVDGGRTLGLYGESNIQ